MLEDLSVQLVLTDFHVVSGKSAFFGEKLFFLFGIGIV